MRIEFGPRNNAWTDVDETVVLLWFDKTVCYLCPLLTFASHLMEVLYRSVYAFFIIIETFG